MVPNINPNPRGRKTTKRGRKPIFDAIHTVFSTELISAGVLTILVALVADVLVVGLQRLVTPWTRTRRTS